MYETAHVTHFFDEPTNTLSYVVRDPNSAACAIVDSVLNLDYASGTISYEGADAIIGHIRREKLELQWILETHVHADHLSAAPYLQERLGGKIAIGAEITDRAERVRQGLQRGNGLSSATAASSTCFSTMATRSRSAASRGSPCTRPATRRPA
jgi:glyoxylase-like metal-dependent hydrolase (beta-lactamase superfamily II)